MTDKRWVLISPIPCPGAMRITGAGAISDDSNVNGDYCPNGDVDGKPSWKWIGAIGFQAPEGDHGLLYWSTGEAQWRLEHEGTLVYTNPDGDDRPTNGSWVPQFAPPDEPPVMLPRTTIIIRILESNPPAKFSEEEDLSVGCKALRRKLTTDIVFTGADYNYFLAIERNPKRRCEEIYIRREWWCRGGWQTVWEGVFSTGAGEWDFDNCTFTVRPDPFDAYTCIMRAANQKINVLGVQPVPSTASIPLDIEFGFSYSWHAASGTGPVPYATQAGMVDGSNSGINGWGLAASYYIGNINQTFASNPPPVPLTTLDCTGEMDGFEGSTLATDIMQGLLDEIGPFIGTTEIDFAIYRHIWWRERAVTLCNFGVPSPPFGTGWTLVTDNCGVDGTALYGRTPSVTYTGGNAGATGIISPSPPIDPCSFYVAAGAFGFDNRPMFVCFDVNGADPVEFNRGRLLQEVANFMLAQTGCNITKFVSDLLEWDPPGDAPGYSPGVNYVNGSPNQYNAIVILQNSDAIDPAASNPATIGELTLKEFFSMLAIGPRIFWALDDDGNIRLEHWTFWTTPIGLDLAAIPDKDKSEPLSYTHMKLEIPRFERPKWANARERDFVGTDVEYFGPCVNADADVKEYNAAPFMTDIKFIISDPDAINKVGFTLLATTFDGSSYNTISDVGALSGDVVPNAPLSWANLEDVFWRNDRLLPSGRMNEVDTVFDGFQPNIEQRNVTVKMCCDYLTFNSVDRVASKLAGVLGLNAGFVRKAEFDETTEAVTLTLRYSY